MKIEALIRRSTEQRAALVACAEPIVRKAAVLDRVVTQVRRHPVVSSVLVGAVALLGPRKILDLGTRALTLYALFRR